MEITKNKITEIFCIIDDFCQEYDKKNTFVEGIKRGAGCAIGAGLVVGTGTLGGVG